MTTIVAITALILSLPGAIDNAFKVYDRIRQLREDRRNE